MLGKLFKKKKKWVMENPCLNLIDLIGSVFNLSERIFKESDSVQPVYTSMHKKTMKSRPSINITDIWIFIK